MKRGQVGSDRRYTKDRVSKVGWLTDGEDYINKLSERIEMITGLEVTLRVTRKGERTLLSSDELQVMFCFIPMCVSYVFLFAWLFHYQD